MTVCPSVGRSQRYTLFKSVAKSNGTADTFPTPDAKRLASPLLVSGKTHPVLNRASVLLRHSPSILGDCVGNTPVSFSCNVTADRAPARPRENGLNM